MDDVRHLKVLGGAGFELEVKVTGATEAV